MWFSLSDSAVVRLDFLVGFSILFTMPILIPSQPVVNGACGWTLVFMARSWPICTQYYLMVFGRILRFPTFRVLAWRFGPYCTDFLALMRIVSQLWLGMALGSSLIGVTIITAVLMIKLSSARTHIKRWFPHFSTSTLYISDAKKQQDSNNVTTIAPIYCYTRCPGDAQFNRFLGCLWTVPKSELVCVSRTWMPAGMFMSFFTDTRIPFLFFTPKVHIISIGVWSSSVQETWLIYLMIPVAM